MRVLKKKLARVICSFAVCTALLGSVTANAAVRINTYNGEGADITTNKLVFEGTVDGKRSNRIASIYIMGEDKTLSDMDDSSAIKYTDAVTVDFNGGFSFDLSLDLPDGTYPVYVVCGDNQNKYDYIYRSWESTKGMFKDIREDNITFETFSEYKDVLGIDLSIAEKSGHKATIVTRLEEINPTDDKDGVDAVRKVIDNCKKEFNLLKQIETAENWAEIPGILKNITELRGTEFDFENKSRQSVCNDLISNVYTGTEALLEAFTTAVGDAPVAGSTDSSDDDDDFGGGGGGGGGGSFSGGGGFGGASTVDPINPEATVTPEKNDGYAFSDIANLDWAIKPINYLYNKGVIDGTGDGKFSPNNNIKREEIVKIIINAFGLYNENATSTFKDMSVNDWYYSFIASAQEQGVVSGITDTEFGVGRQVTRQDMSVMIYNAALKIGKTFKNENKNFSDFGSVADYAQEAVAALAGAEVINGMDDGTFMPQSFATRAQAAKMIYAVIGNN